MNEVSPAQEFTTNKLQEVNISKIQIKAFSNTDLLSSAEIHLKKERLSFELTNWHFQEIQNRKLFLECSFDSLAKMLMGQYGFCEFSAYQRVRVLNLVDELPVIAEAINSGDLSLSNLDKAQSFIKLHEKKNQEALTSHEKLELIERLKNKTTKEVKEYLAKMDPVTTLPSDQVKYLNDIYVQVSWTLEKELLDKLDHLKSLISHDNLNPTSNELMRLMLTETIKTLEKKKGIYVTPKAKNDVDNKNINSDTKPKTTKALKSRYISRKVKRFALKRANHQCEQLHADGKRCSSKFQLEFDHIIAFSKGGDARTENIQVLCRVHNDFKSNH